MRKNPYKEHLPCVDLHERDGQACEEHGDEQEELATPQVRQGADQGGTQEGQQTLSRKRTVVKMLSLVITVVVRLREKTNME